MTRPSRDPQVGAERCTALGAGERHLEGYPGRAVHLGDLPIHRALPIRDRRMVGPWCFLDRFGPLSFTEGRPMDVAAHPHIGLQTVTWLLDGEIAHDDSLNCEAVARPGAVNVMTAGAGIAHAEWTPRENRGRLHGVQLWVALPEAERRRAAAFQHVAQVPVSETPGGIAQVFAGSIGGATSAARHHSALVGADLAVHPRGVLALPLDPAHEHAVLLLGGDAAIEGEELAADTLYSLGTRRTEVEVASRGGGRVLLLGGPPFPETILMWWNFVARTAEEIAAARSDWQAGRHFGAVRGHGGPRLEAPPLGKLARAEPGS